MLAFKHCGPSCWWRFSVAKLPWKYWFIVRYLTYFWFLYYIMHIHIIEEKFHRHIIWFFLVNWLSYVACFQLQVTMIIGDRTLDLRQCIYGTGDMWQVEHFWTGATFTEEWVARVLLPQECTSLWNDCLGRQKDIGFCHCFLTPVHSFHYIGPSPSP